MAKRKQSIYKRLPIAVNRCRDTLSEQFGPEAAVIVMVGIPDGKEHSAFQYAWDGRCLPLEGLLVRVSHEMRKELWRGR